MRKKNDRSWDLNLYLHDPFLLVLMLTHSMIAKCFGNIEASIRVHFAITLINFCFFDKQKWCWAFNALSIAVCINICMSRQVTRFASGPQLLQQGLNIFKNLNAQNYIKRGQALFWNKVSIFQLGREYPKIGRWGYFKRWDISPCGLFPIPRQWTVLLQWPAFVKFIDLRANALRWQHYFIQWRGPLLFDEICPFLGLFSKSIFPRILRPMKLKTKAKNAS